jgi:hypothetical protein
LTKKPKQTRPPILERTKILVWSRAAGRCTFCNTLVTEATSLGEPVPIGELAHNVGWSEDSPRGESLLSSPERADASNLILTCRNCHKPIDDGGVTGRYTVDELIRRKQDHETRIETLTAIGADRFAYVLRVVGDVRGVPPELARPTVLAATTAAGLYPKILPGNNWDSDVDLDLRNRGALDTQAEFERLIPDIAAFAGRIHDGVRRDEVARLAVFAFARIPLLIAFGARLDDKVPTLVFQRHRTDRANAWTWPADERPPVTFDIARIRAGASRKSVALVVNLSGSIPLEDLPERILAEGYVYEIAVEPPAEPGPALIWSAADLASFEGVMRKFLAAVEANHGRVDSIDLFPAVGVSAAVTIGRVLMPHVSPAWNIHDRGSDGRFFNALRVQR